ncbi:Predicted choloylglycine hydrolase [Amphibacillus marinus]|uniref:Predicted choloylglycine hydrolase n=1 Tax=Amphibacillus marinus TaxID=872970 RepID=A0A1H8IS46_9BACI|nr:C45 family peptidase [Amphibacillus marinus]SEN71483.1 Predicted choloylglycine hydrolase [Amphibacillus marinus]
MVSVYSDVIQYKGSHYQFGYNQGLQLKGSKLLANREKQWKSRRKHAFATNVNDAIQLLDQFAPNMVDEIKGLAAALNWSIKEAVHYFSGYYLEVGKSGCSIMTGNQYFVRNYDSHPSGYEGRFVFYHPADGGYASLGPSMQITGRTDGINEKGLVIGYNFTNRIGSGDGFICNMIGRIILEQCATVEEAVKLLKAIPHRTSFSYVVMDQTNHSVVVEATPRSVIVRTANMCTNHFELLKEENRYQSDESVARLAMIKKQWQYNLSPSEAYQIMNKREQQVFSDKYNVWSGTLHTSLYQPDQLNAWVSFGADRLPVQLSLANFLRGDRIRIRRINGLLNTALPFLNQASLPSQ